MRDRADSTSAIPRRRPSVGDALSYVLIAGSVVLAWQIAIQPMLQRAPVEAAIRLAPDSPVVLRRAAEAELAAGRVDNAAALSRDALIRAPFDVRALRVFGLTQARMGRNDQADDILTLAGNWSLRDGAAHAWLVERRLRQGDYTSAFAHADTLVRRRQDIQPEVFRLFTVAATEDPQRALPVIADLLAVAPPWRHAYLTGLSQTPEDLQVAANLAILLQTSAAPLSNAELQRLYRGLLNRRQIDALRLVRSRLNRPSPTDTVTNGGFNDSAAPSPFQWRLTQKAGVTAEIVADDFRQTDPALRLDYNGYATARIAEQLILLSPGSYRLSAAVRAETGDPAARLAWTVTCGYRTQVIGSFPAGPGAGAPDTWSAISGRFEVPAACPIQWLRLETRAADRRSPTVVWFDRITISPSG